MHRVLRRGNALLLRFNTLLNRFWHKCAPCARPPAFSQQKRVFRGGERQPLSNCLPAMTTFVEVNRGRWSDHAHTVHAETLTRHSAVC